MTRGSRARGSVRGVPRRGGVRRAPSGGSHAVAFAGATALPGDRALAGTVAFASGGALAGAVVLAGVVAFATAVAPAHRRRRRAPRRLQRGHEVGDRRVLDAGRRRDLAALGLAGDQLAHAVLDLVVVARRIERAAPQVIDHLASEPELGGRRLDARRRGDLAPRLYLVGVAQLEPREPRLGGAQLRDVLLA